MLIRRARCRCATNAALFSKYNSRMAFNKVRCTDDQPHKWKCRQRTGDFGEHKLVTDLSPEQVQAFLDGDESVCSNGLIYCPKCMRLVNGLAVADYQEDLGFSAQEILDDFNDQADGIVNRTGQ